MNVSMENIKIGAIPEVNRKREAGVKSKINETNTAQQKSEGEIPIGLKAPRIIPTGSVFVPKELVVPPQKPPKEVDVKLIPNEVDNTPLKNKVGDIEGGGNQTTQSTPNSPTQTLDLFV